VNEEDSHVKVIKERLGGKGDLADTDLLFVTLCPGIVSRLSRDVKARASSW